MARSDRSEDNHFDDVRHEDHRDRTTERNQKRPAHYYGSLAERRERPADNVCETESRDYMDVWLSGRQEPIGE